MYCCRCLKSIGKRRNNFGVMCNHCHCQMHLFCYENRLRHHCIDERRSIIEFFITNKPTEMSDRENNDLINEEIKNFTFEYLDTTTTQNLID
jgi:hypothetical protein